MCDNYIVNTSRVEYIFEELDLTDIKTIYHN